MADDKKAGPSMSSPFIRVFHASLLLLGTVIALNLAIAWLRPVLPWLIGGAVAFAIAWTVIAVVRWRRSRY